MGGESEKHGAQVSTAADRLRAARAAAGYKSAAKAAEALGLGASTYASHENGTNGFDADQARRYAEAFGTSAGYLLFGEEARSAPVVIALVRMLERKGVLSDIEARQVFEEAAMIAER